MKSFEERKTEIQRRSQVRLAAIRRNRRTAALCMTCFAVMVLAVVVLWSPSEPIPVQPSEQTAVQTDAGETTTAVSGGDTTVLTTTVSVTAPVQSTSCQPTYRNTTHPIDRTTALKTTAVSKTTAKPPETTAKPPETTAKPPETTVSVAPTTVTTTRPQTTTTTARPPDGTGDIGSPGEPPYDWEGVPPGDWPPYDWEDDPPAGACPPDDDDGNPTTTTTTTTAAAITTTTTAYFEWQ